MVFHIISGNSCHSTSGGLGNQPSAFRSFSNCMRHEQWEGCQIPSPGEKDGKEVNRARMSHCTTADILVVFMWPEHKHPCHAQWSVPRVSHPGRRVGSEHGGGGSCYGTEGPGGKKCPCPPGLKTFSQISFTCLT